MQLTNYIKQTTGWSVPLDDSLCIPGSPLANLYAYNTSYSYYEGWQAWASYGKYHSNGTNSVLLTCGMTNEIVFWGTNTYGTTNDFYLVYNGTSYVNPTPGITYVTNIWVAGSFGTTVSGQIVGASNGLISVRDYLPVYQNGSNGSTDTYMCPPNYVPYGTAYGLTYLTNISPMVTGVPKALLLMGSQNDRFVTNPNLGTNGATAPIYTNGALSFAAGYSQLAQIGHNLGFWPVVGSSIPFSPSSVGGSSYTQFVALNWSLKLPLVQTNLDAFYDWAGSNAPYQNNGAYYADGQTHPTALLANIEATNMALRFAVPKTPHVGP